MHDREFLLARAAARDARYDGVFLTCVRTTGIYCLPSCKARLPKPANVEHCATPQQARARGYRACKRCRPDDFHAGIDRARGALLAALLRVRQEPAAVRGIAALARLVGCGLRRLNALCRRHCAATPAALLRQARLDHACRALRAGTAPVLDIALDAGFRSMSAFHTAFRKGLATTPAAYRRQRRGRTTTRP